MNKSKNAFDLIWDIFFKFSHEIQKLIRFAYDESKTYRSFISWFSIENDQNWLGYPGSGMIWKD